MLTVATGNTKGFQDTPVPTAYPREGTRPTSCSHTHNTRQDAEAGGEPGCPRWDRTLEMGKNVKTTPRVSFGFLSLGTYRVWWWLFG